MLFLKSHFSQMDCIMNLFEDIYNHDIFGGCGESGIKIGAQILIWEPFRTNSQKTFYTHIKSYRAVSTD